METPLASAKGRPEPSPASGSLADLPFVNAEEAPSAVVFSRRVPAADGSGTPGPWRDVTAAEFAEQVADVAKGLIEAGIEAGDRIAIMSRTRYEWTLLDFAAWAAGAVVVPIYPTASAEQAAWAIRDSGIRAVIAEDASCAQVIEKALNWSGVLLSPPRVWRLDEGGAEELMMRGGLVDDAVLTGRRSAVSPGSVATVVYTSGTAGMPKGAPLTHGNFLSAAANGVAMLGPLLSSVPGEPPSTLLFLPLAHVLARVLEVSCVQARIRVGHSPSLRAADLRPDLETFGATFLTGVPYVFEKIHQLGRAEARARGRGFVYDRATRVAIAYARRSLAARAGDGTGPSLFLRASHRFYEARVYRQVRDALGGKVREAICGGSALSPDLMLFFAGAGVMIYEGYGLTETSGPATVNPPARPRAGTVGPPLPGAAVRIAEDGEVLLRGPQVFAGYQPSLAGSSAAGESSSAGEPAPSDGPAPSGGSPSSGGPLAGDGWFATGDLGRLDSDGYLTITGRKKDILITHGGKNVSPGPMEDQLRAHPVVSQCIVVGNDRPYVAALVTVDRDQFVLGAAEDALSGASDLPAGAVAGSDVTGVSAGSTVSASEIGGVEVQSAITVPSSVAAEVARAVRDVNGSVSRPESIRRVRIVGGDFTRDNGLLSASLKVRRESVLDAYEADLNAVYS
ncbi:MAG: AMP-dependent synthetase/ligase [Streptosporangiales bacterium]|nr:AMP-dependent synthetase/ligase [Streptosporangiales bacterium]